MEAPSWLTKGEVGRLGLTKEDLPSNEKPKTVKRPETSIKDFTGGLNPEQAEILGSHAIENVKWNLRSKPYGVQAYALLQCGDSRGFGFFLEQGLGKTKTTLADFWNRYNSGFNDCMVVVTVNSMKATWRREMEDENYPFDIHVWPEFKSLPSNTQGQVVVINYEALFRRGGKMLFRVDAPRKTLSSFRREHGFDGPYDTAIEIRCEFSRSGHRDPMPSRQTESYGASQSLVSA